MTIGFFYRLREPITRAPFFINIVIARGAKSKVEIIIS